MPDPFKTLTSRTLVLSQTNIDTRALPDHDLARRAGAAGLP